MLGSDGSGKSTLVKETVAWLGTKLDVVPIYFGSGDGPGSLYRLPLQLARSGHDALLGRAKATHAQDGGAARRRPALRSLALVPWALTLSLEKRGKLRRMIQARNRGMIVICDRYPQADFPGFNDGPLLDHLHASRWRICRAAAAWEARPYVGAGQDPPDLIVKLLASPEVALTRRPEMAIEEIRRRVDGVRNLRFAAPATVAEITAMPRWTRSPCAPSERSGTRIDFSMAPSLPDNALPFAATRPRRRQRRTGSLRPSRSRRRDSAAGRTPGPAPSRP